MRMHAKRYDRTEQPVVYRSLGKTSDNRNFIVYTLDFLSIPEYVIKKGRPHGHRYGKAPENKEYYLAHNLKKEMHKKKLHRDP